MNRPGVQRAFHIGEPSEVAAARRAGSEMARRLEFDEVRAGQLALLITEAATNIVKHAGGGEILLRALYQDGFRGIEVIALDAGPGMHDIDLRMADGVSTTGSYGVGLGALQRLASQFDVYTAPGQGAVFVMTLWRGAAPPPLTWQIGAVCLALAGEPVCGDAWDALTGADDVLNVLVADGLGHGPDAAAASEGAVTALQAHPTCAPAPMMQVAHTALHGTRGAAVAVARIDPGAGELRFAGVGNIAACLFGGGESRHLLSHNGIVGSNLRKVQEFAHPWQAGAMLVMHSDGIGTRWNLDHYPGLARRHPGLIAAVLYRDFVRRRDDATVLVIRQTI